MDLNVPGSIINRSDCLFFAVEFLTPPQLGVDVEVSIMHLQKVALKNDCSLKGSRRYFKILCEAKSS